jgi:spermidine synthase
LVLDGVVQITERDGNSYNEMLSHIPMFQNAHPRRVLVIGGGDGYVVSEVLKHESVEYVDHVDLDTDVIETCKKFFSWSDAWNDPRVHLHIADGAKFVRAAADQSYDVIIQDSSDPWKWGQNGEQVDLPSSVLYSPEHFHNVFRILKPNGVLNIQAESLQIPSDLNGIQSWRKIALSVGFESAMYGSIMISSYPTGQIGFLLCEKDCSAASSLDLVENRFRRIVDANKSTTYYHPPLQTGSFVLPLWAMKHIYSDKDTVYPKALAEEL